MLFGLVLATVVLCSDCYENRQRHPQEICLKKADFPANRLRDSHQGSTRIRFPVPNIYCPNRFQFAVGGPSVMLQSGFELRGNYFSQIRNLLKSVN